MQHIGRITECNQKFLFEWEIKDFLSYTEENTQYCSPEFQILNSTCCIIICPNHIVTIDDTSVSYVSLHLHRITLDSTMEEFEVGFAIKSSTDEYDYKKMRSVPDKNMKMIQWDQFLKRFSLEVDRDLVPSGILTIVCFIEFKKQEFQSRPDKLVEDLKHLFSSKKNYDVILKINEDTISAHKAILATRSPVFSAMFENDMEEKKTGVVNISDCDLEPFNAFLHYLYTGEAELSKCDALQVYKIADKYGVPELMKLCLDFIICNLSIENVFETFVFGKKLDVAKIVSYSQHFFNENFKAIIFSNTWKSFMAEDPDLANDLLQGMALTMNVN